MIVFISGGVRSGKSQYAEQRALQLSSQQNAQLYYIATSHVYDQEMKSRVEKHQQQRIRSGANWKVYEQPREIDQLLPLFQNGDVILLDCLTTLLSNELFAGWETNEDKWKNDDFIREVETKIKRLFTTIATSSYFVFIVSNELAYDVPLNEQGSNVYIKVLGRIHQFIVSLATEAILVENGLACFKKGGECT
ncbi:bifunctional adenosylcobinamide kinase/adenosylcobinamide-phosphate guanylyltransferase [Alkalihalobacillus deserti]|uniref:bifunctional adenosylcobinamide kinase/adenosylcobinamide-phosphate guanylyltransferase n=1 Tax=Alkalihalobacillus deserti TaxID=2879466 RepID=UPI001D13C848|nr:bifunctional adenosylcobinamide kinase/adenosylcobinamide-phosphate guanylyltransferase [Alkalihalobacillus deserti]